MIDALLPDEMARKAEAVGVKKAHMGFMKTLVLGILAGSFIAFGAVFATTVTAGSTLPYGVTKLLGGIVFSLGLILVIVGGAELFTGNNLIVMAWANKKVSTRLLLRNWALVYLGNLIGSMAIVVLIFLSKQYTFGQGEVGINMLQIARAKCELGFLQALSLGILCNVLVCLAVWLCYSATTITGKILAIIFPISAFVAAGFEHCIANMYFIPMGIAVKNWGGMEAGMLASGKNFDVINWHNYFVHNLLPVTIGNIIGGAVLVGLVYWFVFLRDQKNT
jgi:formate/nitrite transporter